MLQQTVFLGLSIRTNISICPSCFFSAVPFHSTGLKYSQPLHVRAKARFSYRGLKRNLLFESHTRSFGLEEKYTLEDGDALHCFHMYILGKSIMLLWYCDRADHMLHKGLYVMNYNTDGIQNVYWQWNIILPYRALLQKQTAVLIVDSSFLDVLTIFIS